MAAHKALASKPLWQEQVDRYRQQADSLQGELKILADQLKDKTPPDLAPLQEAVRQTGSTAHTLATRTGALQ